MRRDPYEHHNLIDELPQVRAELEQVTKQLEALMVEKEMALVDQLGAGGVAGAPSAAGGTASVDAPNIVFNVAPNIAPEGFGVRRS